MFVDIGSSAIRVATARRGGFYQRQFGVRVRKGRLAGAQEMLTYSEGILSVGVEPADGRKPNIDWQATLGVDSYLKAIVETVSQELPEFEFQGIACLTGTVFKDEAINWLAKTGMRCGEVDNALAIVGEFLCPGGQALSTERLKIVSEGLFVVDCGRQSTRIYFVQTDSSGQLNWEHVEALPGFIDVELAVFDQLIARYDRVAGDIELVRDEKFFNGTKWKDCSVDVTAVAMGIVRTMANSVQCIIKDRPRVAVCGGGARRLLTCLKLHDMDELHHVDTQSPARGAAKCWKYAA